MLVAHFQVIVCELVLVMLVLGSFYFILVCVFGFLVEVGVPLTVYANPEYLVGLGGSVRS